MQQSPQPWSPTRRDLGLRTVFLTASSEDVARVYAGIGFRRVATGWAAERH